MLKITKEYLEQNINLEEIHEYMDIVDSSNELIIFTIGDLKAEIDFNYFTMDYSLAFSLPGFVSPEIKINKNFTVEKIAEALYETNKNTKVLEFIESEYNLYLIFSSLIKKYEEDTKFDAFGAQLMYNRQHDRTILYIDDLVIPCSKYLDCELEDFTSVTRYLSKINMLEAVETLINCQKA